MPLLACPTNWLTGLNRRDVTWREDAELGRNARRACNLALLRSALLGLLLREGSLNLSALTQHHAAHPAAALRLLFHPHPHLWRQTGIPWYVFDAA